MSIFIDTLTRIITDSITDAEATREDWQSAIDQAFGPAVDTPGSQSDQDMATIQDAARSWVHELEEYIIPDASDSDEDRNSYIAQRDRINQALQSTT